MDTSASATSAPGMSYSQSFSQAQYHGKNLIKSTIGQHPSATAAVMGVLVLLVLILAFALVHYKDKSKAGFEGLTAGPPKNPCPPNYTLRTDGTSQYCVPGAYMPDLSACKVSWDPAASAEAQALATVGSLQHDSYGERSLQSAINAAYDVDGGLTDAQLQGLMHQGGAP